MILEEELPGHNPAYRAALAGLLAACFLISCPPAWARSAASISGTVVDPSGAVVAGATVVLHDSEHGARQTYTTGNDGSYTFTGLVPGRYQIEIAAPGI